jgi:hypothetical protein
MTGAAVPGDQAAIVDEKPSLFIICSALLNRQGVDKFRLGFNTAGATDFTSVAPHTIICVIGCWLLCWQNALMYFHNCQFHDTGWGLDSDFLPRPFTQ